MIRHAWSGGAVASRRWGDNEQKERFIAEIEILARPSAATKSRREEFNAEHAEHAEKRLLLIISSASFALSALENLLRTRRN